jgi:sulfur relay (sulfurtransferase) DsrC/TusE family protein
VVTEKQVQELKKRNEPLEYPISKNWKKEFEAYIFEGSYDEDDPDNWKQGKQRTNKLLQDAYALVNFLKKHQEKFRKIPSKKNWVKKIEEAGPRADEQRNRVSPIFWNLGPELWIARMTRKEAMELSDKLNLHLHFGDGMLAGLCIPDVEQIAIKYYTTPDNIRKLLRRWIVDIKDYDKIYKPYINVGYSGELKKGGKMVVAVGYWSKRTQHPLFTEADSKEWVRSILFRKKT